MLWLHWQVVWYGYADFRTYGTLWCADQKAVCDVVAGRTAVLSSGAQAQRDLPIVA